MRAEGASHLKRRPERLSESRRSFTPVNARGCHPLFGDARHASPSLLVGAGSWSLASAGSWSLVSAGRVPLVGRGATTRGRAKSGQGQAEGCGRESPQRGQAGPVVTGRQAGRTNLAERTCGPVEWAGRRNLGRLISRFGKPGSNLGPGWLHEPGWVEEWGQHAWAGYVREEDM